MKGACGITFMWLIIIIVLCVYVDATCFLHVCLCLTFRGHSRQQYCCSDCMTTLPCFGFAVVKLTEPTDLRAAAGLLNSCSVEHITVISC